MSEIRNKAGLSKRNLALVLLLNCILDYLYYIVPDQSIVAIVRLLLNITYVIVSYLSSRTVRTSTAQFLVIMIFYYVIRLLLGVNQIDSLIEFLKFLMGIAFLYISVTSYVGSEDLRIFYKTLFFTLPLYLTFVFISNLYDVGSQRYTGAGTGDFQVALGDAKLYVPALVSGLYPSMVSLSLIKRSVVRDILVLSVFLILLVSLRRTAIFIVLAFWIPYFIRSVDWRSIFKPGFLIIASLLLFITPTITEIFNKRLESRAYLVENYSIEDEGRYQEIRSLFSTFGRSSKPLVNIFGTGDFVTAGKYGFKDTTRPIHQDYVYLYFSFGGIGMLLYCTFLTILYRASKVGDRRSLLNRTYAQLVILFILIGISGNIWAISYKIYILSIIGLFHSAIRNHVNMYEK